MSACFPQSLHGVEHAVEQLILKAGFPAKYDVRQLPGGANNRVYRVEVNGQRALLKAYFHSKSDPRERLGTEFRFCRFAWNHGIRCLPEPLVCDVPHRLGLYEFVMGRTVMAHEIDADKVQHALDFYQELNTLKHLPEAQGLPAGSEACFTIAEHLECVARRLRTLAKIDDSSPLAQEAADFIRGELSGTWRQAEKTVRQRAGEQGWPLDQTLPDHEKCLSPSDFGFHNALMTGDGGLRFIDFEYAGWDDPAKLVCDFFCQPALPVPRDYYEMFTFAVAANLADPERELQRFSLLMPVYQLKWCCILLNDFLPVGHKRRLFAQDGGDQEVIKRQQLDKARLSLQQLHERGDL